MRDLVFIVVAILVVLAILLFIIIRNKKDRKDLEQTLGENYEQLHEDNDAQTDTTPGERI